MTSLAGTVLSLLCSAAPAAPAAPAAAPHRIAVVVGANRAPGGLTPLKYAHRDALSIAEALVDVGEFAKQDVHVLLEASGEAILAALDAVALALKDSPRESLLLFYYSGHADDGALYPNGQPLSVDQLRVRLEATGATVRIGILDACRGGAWTRAKGLRPTTPFQLNLPLGLVSEGSALLASSSGLEDAHETESLQGSFFTHYLVAGLRGAAARESTGQVTLQDAFAYADKMTIRDTAARSVEPQHPSFDWKLHGRQDVVLSRVGSSPSSLVLVEEHGPLQLVQLSTGVVVLEVPPGQQTWRLAVPPGDYLVRRMAAGGGMSREVTVSPGEPVHLSEADLQLVASPGLAKGGETSVARQQEMSIAFNVLPFGAYTKGLGPELRYGFHLGSTLGLAARLSYAAAVDTGLKQELITQFGVLPGEFASYEWSGAIEGVARWPRRLNLGGSWGLWGELAAGPGFVTYTPSPGSGVRPALDLGAAVCVGAGEELNLRLAFRDEIVAHRVTAGGGSSGGSIALDNVLSAQLGLTYSFGAPLTR